MNSECALITCLVDNLESGGGAVVELNMRIFEDTFLKVRQHFHLCFIVGTTFFLRDGGNK